MRGEAYVGTRGLRRQLSGIDLNAVYFRNGSVVCVCGLQKLPLVGHLRLAEIALRVDRKRPAGLEGGRVGQT